MGKSRHTRKPEERLRQAIHAFERAAASGPRDSVEMLALYRAILTASRLCGEGPDRELYLKDMVRRIWAPKTPLIDGVFAVLVDAQQKRGGLTPTEIRYRLDRYGYHVGGSNPASGIHRVLRRLLDVKAIARSVPARTHTLYYVRRRRAKKV